uniref:Uncharacterized protein n=1 Tax=Micrurus lemniscatus lemniscatus TaxID=129467 RepID=A0A2D4J782_MICLE
MVCSHFKKDFVGHQHPSNSISLFFPCRPMTFNISQLSENEGIGLKCSLCTLLEQGGPHGYVANISLYYEGFLRVEMFKRWLLLKELFELFESCLTFHSPVKVLSQFAFIPNLCPFLVVQ